ncbi:hypothetical protein ABPG72_020808 [Tetrahymena utriculariae]
MAQLINLNQELNMMQSNNSMNRMSVGEAEKRNLTMKGSFQFTIGRENNDVKANEPKVMEPSLEDELLLTQLALDDRKIIIYDIASVIYLGERQRNTPLQTFKCFYDVNNKNFFVELSDKSPLEHLTKSTFLKILDIAESIGAERVYVCLHNKTTEIGSKIQTLMFVGFHKIMGQELQRVSKTRTHTLLCYDLNE